MGPNVFWLCQRRCGGGGWHKASASACLPLAAPIGLSPPLILTLCGSERVLVVSTEMWGGGLAQGLSICLFAFGSAYWPLATAHSDPLWVRTCLGCVNGDVGGGGLAPGLGICLFAFGSAYWPLATAHSDPLWVRMCFGCVNGDVGGGGGWHQASASACLPLAAPIGLSPPLILTLCGSERVLVVSTEMWGGGWHKASASACLPLAAPIGLSPPLILTLCGSERVLVVSTEMWGGGLAQGLSICLFAFGSAYWPLATAHSDPLWVRTCFGCVNGDVGGGGLAPGLGICLFAFGSAYWPLATAHSDPLWVRTCFGCVNGAPG